MNAIFNTRTKQFKTYEGWSEYVEDKKGKVIKGLEDALLFTEQERNMNTLAAPLEWRHINPRVNWRMFK